MKKLLCTILALVMLLCLASAASAEKIGVAMPTQSLQRWNQDGSYMKAMLEAAGYEVVLTYSDNDVARQVSDIENMLTDGCEVLVIASIDGSSLGTVLETAKLMEVPVIAYDRMITDTDAVDYYATFDNYMVGVIQGTYIIEALDLASGAGPFNLEVVGGSPDDSNAGFFLAGAMDLLTPYIENGQLVVQSGQTTLAEVGTLTWSTAVAQARFENIITGFYSGGEALDAVLCSNDSTAMGVINALTAAGYTEFPVITGQDCDKPNMLYIVSGVQSMSVFKDTRTLAEKVVGMVDALMKGAEPEINDVETYFNGVKIIPSYLCVPVFGSADNYQELLIESGYYVEIDGEFFTPDEVQ